MRRPAPQRPPDSSADWARRWAEVRRANPAFESQRRRPSRWRRFYDECGSLLEAVRGFSPAAGRTAAAALVRAAGLGPGDRVVDLGSGRGWLAAALAARGLRVLAVDESRPAVAAVLDRARHAGLSRLLARRSSWLALSPGRPADLALAAFFPNVWTPQGFRRLERLGRRCAVLWGEGVRALPWTSGLWRRLFGKAPSAAGDLGHAAVGWLLASGRSFAVERMQLPLRVDRRAEDFFEFYRRYFALFDCPAERIEEALAAELRPRLRRGRLQFAGVCKAVLLLWRRPVPPGRDAR